VAKKSRRNKDKVGEEKNEDVDGEERKEAASLTVQAVFLSVPFFTPTLFHHFWDDEGELWQKLQAHENILVEIKPIEL
jgi:hypothetical protein